MPIAAFGPDTSPVQFDELFANGQSKSDTTAPAFWRTFTLVKSLKDTGEFRFFDADAGILDRNQNLIILLTDAHRDAAAFCKTDSIVENVKNDLADASRIDMNRRQI